MFRRMRSEHWMFFSVVAFVLVATPFATRMQNRVSVPITHEEARPIPAFRLQPQPEPDFFID